MTSGGRSSYERIRASMRRFEPRPSASGEESSKSRHTSKKMSYEPYDKERHADMLERFARKLHRDLAAARAENEVLRRRSAEREGVAARNPSSSRKDLAGEERGREGPPGSSREGPPGSSREDVVVLKSLSQKIRALEARAVETKRACEERLRTAREAVRSLSRSAASLARETRRARREAERAKETARDRERRIADLEAELRRVRSSSRVDQLVLGTNGSFGGKGSRDHHFAVYLFADAATMRDAWVRAFAPSRNRLEDGIVVAPSRCESAFAGAMVVVARVAGPSLFETAPTRPSPSVECLRIVERESSIVAPCNGYSRITSAMVVGGGAPTAPTWSSAPVDGLRFADAVGRESSIVVVPPAASSSSVVVSLSLLKTTSMPSSSSSVSVVDDRRAVARFAARLSAARSSSRGIVHVHESRLRVVGIRESLPRIVREEVPHRYESFPRVREDRERPYHVGVSEELLHVHDAAARVHQHHPPPSPPSPPQRCHHPHQHRAVVRFSPVICTVHILPPSSLLPSPRRGRSPRRGVFGRSRRDRRTSPRRLSRDRHRRSSSLSRAIALVGAEDARREAVGPPREMTAIERDERWTTTTTMTTPSSRATLRESLLSVVRNAPLIVLYCVVRPTATTTTTTTTALRCRAIVHRADHQELRAHAVVSAQRSLVAMSSLALLFVLRPPSCPNVGGVVPSGPVARESWDHRRHRPRPVDATPTRPRSDTAPPPPLPPSTRRLSLEDAPFDSRLSSHRQTKNQREICVTFAPNLERVRRYVPDDRRSRGPWFQPSHTATVTTSPFLPVQQEERTLASPHALTDSDSDSDSNYDSDDYDAFATVSVESDTNDGGRARTILSLSRKQILWCLWAMTGGRSIREFDLRGRTITDGLAVGDNDRFVSGLESLLGTVCSTNTTTKTMRSATLRLLPRRRHDDESSWWFGGGGRLFAPDRGSSSRPTIALVVNVFDRAAVHAAAAALGRSKAPPFTYVAPFFRRETVLAAPSSARLPIAPPPTSSVRGPCAPPSAPSQHRATLPTPPSSSVVAEKAVRTVAKDAVRTVASPSSNPLHPPPRERIRERLLEQRRRNLLLSSRVLDDPPTAPNNDDDDDDDGGDAVFPFRSSVVAQRRLALRQRTPRPTATATKDDARTGADDDRDAAEETRDDDAPRRAILDPDKRRRVTFSTAVRTLLFAPDDRVRAVDDDDADDAPARRRRRRRAPRSPTTTAAPETVLYDKRGYKEPRTKKAYKYKHVRA